MIGIYEFNYVNIQLIL